MKCPVCGKEMEEGGIIGNGALSIDWYPRKEFEKKWSRALYYNGGFLLTYIYNVIAEIAGGEGYVWV